MMAKIAYNFLIEIYDGEISYLWWDLDLKSLS